MAALSGLFGAETERRMALRHAVMIGTHGEQRRALRLLTTAPAVVFADGQRHIGLVRDLSSTGLFVYSDFTPELGTELKLTIRFSRDKNKTAIFICTGRVVRVEEGRNGAAVGMGLKFEGQGEVTSEIA
jgi:PilZ domain-containing protein